MEAALVAEAAALAAAAAVSVAVDLEEAGNEGQSISTSTGRKANCCGDCRKRAPRVFVSEKEIEDAFERAKARFVALGMEQTRNRNAVLIYFAPRSHKFAVVGDTAVHERCGEDFWRQLIGVMQESLKNRQFTEAVVLAVEKCGALLAQHFPPDADGTNELPDQIERD